jgi:hypothetical protein
MRLAFAGSAPADVLRRFSKGYAAPFLLRRFKPIAADLRSRLDRLRVVDAGYIDPESLGKRLDGVLNGSVSRLGNLVNIAALELWFEARAGRFEPSVRTLIERR